jgi:hypothetical protein
MHTFLPTTSRLLDPSKLPPLKNNPPPSLPPNPLLLLLLKLPLNNRLKTSSSALDPLVFLNPPSELNKRLSFSPVLDPLKLIESVFNSVRSTSSMVTSLNSVNNKEKVRRRLNNSSNLLPSKLNRFLNNRPLKRPLFRNNLNKFTRNLNKLKLLLLNKFKSNTFPSNSNNSKCTTNTNNTRLLKVKITLDSLNLLSTNNLRPSLATELLRLTEVNSNISNNLNKPRSRNKLLLRLTKLSSNPRLSPPLTSNNPLRPTLLLPSLNSNKPRPLNLPTPRSTRFLNNNNNRKLLSVRPLPTTRASTVKIV